MKLFSFLLAGVACIVLTATTLPLDDPQWGFFGHRRINRLAVFTLDQEMMPFFRANIEWVTDHAVDPDKRRYASPFEAVRHYIDLDHWGESETFPDVPRSYTDAQIWKAELVIVGQGKDSTTWKVTEITHPSPERRFYSDSRVQMSSSKGKRLELQLGSYRSFWFNNVWPQFYEDRITLSPDSLRAIGFPLPEEAPKEIFVREKFSEYGMLPYHLESMHKRITQAFIEEDTDKILRLCAEMGHYIGDAHVPLHTTENYNGQMTGQTGIHGFWESRIPELFADDTYDYFVGKAQYIENPRDYYWGIVLKSHSLVDSVLRTEQRLRDTYPEDQQMCFDERSGRTIKTQCAEFAAAWDREMQGMVEERFRASILSVGSVWFTCWVDAGQPDLNKLSPEPIIYAKSDTLDKAVLGGEIKGRAHD